MTAVGIKAELALRHQVASEPTSPLYARANSTASLYAEALGTGVSLHEWPSWIRMRLLQVTRAAEYRYKQEHRRASWSKGQQGTSLAGQQHHQQQQQQRQRRQQTRRQPRPSRFKWLLESSLSPSSLSPSSSPSPSPLSHSQGSGTGSHSVPPSPLLAQSPELGQAALGTGQSGGAAAVAGGRKGKPGRNRVVLSFTVDAGSLGINAIEMVDRRCPHRLQFQHFTGVASVAKRLTGGLLIAGMVLTHINDADMRGVPYDQILAELKPRPCKLAFSSWAPQQQQ
jgi:hypothetical protein